jgi:sortase A
VSLRRRSAALVGGLGLVLLVQGCWIPSKAWLAHVLVAHAWERALAGEARPRPWPWADTWPVARLTAPKLGVERFVLAGSSGRTLAFGPGHVETTSPPGAAGNSVLAGHRDTSFAFLADLAVGDDLSLTTPDGREHHYQVTWTAVVDQADTRSLEPTPEKALTLVTCWPFDAVRPGGRGRYVVRAEALSSQAGLDAGLPADSVVGGVEAPGAAGNGLEAAAAGQ